MLQALPGEHYVELVAPGVRPEDHRSFPARIEKTLLSNKFGARARLRADVLPALQRWLLDNPALQMEILLDPVGAGRPYRQPVTVRTAGDGWERTHKVWPDTDGLYALHGDETWFWQVSVPATTAAVIKSAHRNLVKPSNLSLEPGEEFVSLEHGQVAFPAIIEDESWNDAAVPHFRPRVARMVTAWLNYVHMTVDEAYSRAYWEDDTIIIVESNSAASEGYLPDRVTPGPDGRYAIGWRGWLWTIP